MFMNRFFGYLPKSFLWRLTLLNFIVVTVAILLSGWSIYHMACFLVESYEGFSSTRQNEFSRTLFQYLLLFGSSAVIISTAVQYYFTKKLIRPINELIVSTQLLKTGNYQDPIQVHAEDEIGELIKNYNELQNQLLLNEQYRTKLVQDVSHELRTPIANLTGYMQALKTGVIEGDQALFTSLHEQTIRLKNLVEQIEHLNEWDNVSEKQPLKKEKKDIKAMILQAGELFSWQLQKYNMKLNVDAAYAPLFIHPNGIQQVLTNLLDNAIRYYQGNEPITMEGIKEDSQYVISISSPGKKIEAEEKEQLFERFYRMEASRDRKTGGTGLGLAIVKEIIDNHEGTIDVQSENGMNTFIVYLPIHGV